MEGILGKKEVVKEGVFSVGTILRLLAETLLIKLEKLPQTLSDKLLEKLTK